MIRENQKYFNRLLVVLDVVMILLSFIMTWCLKFKNPLFIIEGGILTFKEYLRPAILILPIILVTFSAFKLYTPFRHKSFLEEVWNIITGCFVSMFIFFGCIYILKIQDYSRTFSIVFIAISAIMIIIERGVVRRSLHSMRAKGYNQKHILIVGCSELTIRFLERINRNKQWGYNVVGLVDDGIYMPNMDEKEKEIFSKIERIGSIDDLEEIFSKEHIDEVFITLNIKEYEKLGKIINKSEKYGIRTEIIPDYSKYIPARPYVEELDGLPVINIRYIPLDNLVNKFVKRTIDIIGSLVLIILFSPIMIGVAIFTKITSPGPIIFKQERVGLNNKIFTMFKFRSMKVQSKEEEKSEWTTENDPRKTKFGSFIRKTSLDELPQFFNVLIGDMSLVGPRPERPYFVDQFKDEIPKYMVKHQIRPGITGWAQVNGLRGDTSIEKRVEYDIYYLENWTFWFDIKILFLTVFKGFVNKNAY